MDAVSEAPRAALDPVAGPWQRVSSRYIAVDLIGNVIAFLVPIVISAVVAVLSGLPWLWLVPVALTAIAIPVCALTPRRVRAIGYRLREDDLLYRRGILFQRMVAVPYGRMQLVDINRGPIARGLGLAELKLVTAAAATGVTIPGLRQEDAEQLRDHLVAVAESRRAGL